MFSVVLTAFAPSVAFLLYFYLKDRTEQEPLGLVIRLFLFGGLIVFPVMILQHVLLTEISNHPLFMSFIATGLVEEFFKWLLFMFFIYHHIEFNERFDAIVYSVAISMGFATLENFFYLLLDGISTAYLRALFPVSGHALFGVLMGYYISRAKFSGEGKREKFYLLLSLSIPFILHGIYDTLLLWVDHWFLLLLPFMGFLWMVALKKAESTNLPSKNLTVRQDYGKEISLAGEGAGKGVNS
ncbi:Protease PrsW [[Clostridium] ultunense Esp]|nr:Protease PrsW [[Clostridium] ultunense Esp]